MRSPLAGLTLLILGAVGGWGLGCGSSSLTSGGGTGGAAGGQGGRAGGLAGAGGVAGGGGGVGCGSVHCLAGMYCCNVACGICAPPGGGCVAGCALTGGSGGGGSGGAGTAGSGGGAGRVGAAGFPGGGGSGGAGSGSGGAGSGGGGSGSGGSGSGGSGSGGGGAGSGGGSSGADGGQQVDGGVSCSEFQSQYAAALPAAERCDVDAGGQCTNLAGTSFPLVYCGPGCGMTYVNDVKPLSSVTGQGFRAGCIIEIVCNDLCWPPTGAVCVSTDGGSGTCRSAISTGP
jgi:hypothetical protein